MLWHFCGEEYLITWLNKVKFVVRLQNIVDITSLIPLCLEGDALVLYLELREEELQDAEITELRFKEAVTEGPFGAYSMLSSALDWGIGRLC